MLGQTISHYRVTEKLGEGVMGVVYRAEDTKLERPVALKSLATHTIENPEHKARFIREEKAAARLDHQNICLSYVRNRRSGRANVPLHGLPGRPNAEDEIAERPLKLDEALQKPARPPKVSKRPSRKRLFTGTSSSPM